jgi:uracil-DNA glycosylase
LPSEPTSFVERLAAAQIGETFNFYGAGAGAGLRRRRLCDYLESRAEARLLLVGEAAGYRGARVSGIPFTSERQVSGGAPGEATATVVHRVLDELGIAAEVLLWNLVPTHPHRPGRSHSNRTPTRAEIEAGAPFFTELVRGRHVISVGRLAAARLGSAYVRHPAHGGSAAFRAGLLHSLRGAGA